MFRCLDSNYVLFATRGASKL